MSIHDMRRILVTGYRHMTDKSQWLVTDTIRWVGPGIIVHGDAKGADRLATVSANVLGWPLEKHPADWKRLGNAAGPKRNQEMVDKGASICVAFLAPSSKGTRDCIQRAIKAGIMTVIVPVLDDEDGE